MHRWGGAANRTRARIMPIRVIVRRLVVAQADFPMEEAPAVSIPGIWRSRSPKGQKPGAPQAICHPHPPGFWRGLN